MRKECRRCSSSDGLTSGPFCMACMDVVKARIWRWMNGERFHSNAEFAEEVGLSVSAVEQHVSRMRRKGGPGR